MSWETFRAPLTALIDNRPKRKRKPKAPPKRRKGQPAEDPIEQARRLRG